MTEPGLVVEDLHLLLPDRRSLLDAVSVRIEAGERILVNGPYGSGKSTLFRALAGIWPYGTGKVALAATRRVLFVPQRPYLPIATLCEVLSYPDQPGGHTERNSRRLSSTPGCPT